MTSISVATLMIVAGACGPEPLEIPVPPNIDAVLAAYDSPTGTIDPAQLKQTLADAEARLQQLHLDWLPTLIVNVVSRMRQRFESSGLAVDPATNPNDNHRNIDAVVKATHSCTGDQISGESPTSQQNGTLDLTAVVQDGRLMRSIWGSATNCQERITLTDKRTIVADLDGNLLVYLYGALPRTTAELRLLVHLETQSSSLDFRVLSGMIEFRLPVKDGDIIVSVSPNQLTLHGRNQTAVCDLNTRACSSASGP